MQNPFIIKDRPTAERYIKTAARISGITGVLRLINSRRVRAEIIKFEYMGRYIYLIALLPIAFLILAFFIYKKNKTATILAFILFVGRAWYGIRMQGGLHITNPKNIIGIVIDILFALLLFLWILGCKAREELPEYANK